ncbi:MAG: aldehyde dehydrogenase [Planctomycetota bacterium]
MRTLSNVIGGKRVAPASGSYLDSFNPATQEINARVPDSDARDVEAAVRAAQAAFPAWSQMAVSRRSQILLAVAETLERRLEEFARAESEDQGKPISLARRVDIPRAVTNFRHFGSLILHQVEDASEVDQRALNIAQRLPMGVCGLISPWNLPLYLATWKIAPAIAMGNTCVVKPSEFTSVTAFMLMEVLEEAGVPPGVVNMVFGYGPKAGQALVEHPGVPLISFTGGTVTGKAILAASATTVKKVGLELGGKNPNIIFDGADIAAAASTSVRSSFQNQGEICLCGSRILVHRQVYEPFKKAFLEAAAKFKVGDPSKDDTDMGPLVSKPHFEKVLSYIELAKKEGGRLLLGGDRPKLGENLEKGNFLNPTVFENLGPQCRVNQEEVFGPFVTLTPFDTEDEAVAMANGVGYGLSASVWERDITKAHRVARRLEAGTVWVNTWMLRDLRVPFGGMKLSGLGREGGSHSVDFYTQLKNICVNLEV